MPVTVDRYDRKAEIISDMVLNILQSGKNTVYPALRRKVIWDIRRTTKAATRAAVPVSTTPI
jgi:hypothetical protein